MRMGQGVRTGLGHGGITCVLQTQFSSLLKHIYPYSHFYFLWISVLDFIFDFVWTFITFNTYLSSYQDMQVDQGQT